MITLTDEQYESTAINAIREYKHFPFAITDEEIKTKYAVAIELIIENYKNSFTIDKNIKQTKQGERDTTFKDSISIVDDGIKLLLGYPYVSFTS